MAFEPKLGQKPILEIVVDNRREIEISSATWGSNKPIVKIPDEYAKRLSPTKNYRVLNLNAIEVAKVDGVDTTRYVDFGVRTGEDLLNGLELSLKAGEAQRLVIIEEK